MKRIIVSILLIIFIFSIIPFNAFAESVNENKNEDAVTLGEVGGYLRGAVNSITKANNERNFVYPGGHGFAAEQANNLIDRTLGLDASVVGFDNIKNGPDRKINNHDGSVTWIQDKYYKSAYDSLNKAFDDETGLYRYYDNSGCPMQLEVPKDQYDDVLKGMKTKIEEGRVPGVTDSKEAENLVREGHYTHKQAENLAKAGNVDSLFYDAISGTITAASAFGITFMLDYVSCIMNGENSVTALNEAIKNGIKTGATVFAISTISSQLCKAGLANKLLPFATSLANTLGDNVKSSILAVFEKEGATLATSATNAVANILATNIVVDGVTIALLTVPDIVELFQGRISSEQLLIDLTTTIFSTICANVGAIGGATLGALIANAPGATAGFYIGGLAGGIGGEFLSKEVLSHFLEDDAEKMYKIINSEFSTLAEEYLVNTDEADNIIEKLSEQLSSKKLKDMFKSEDREQFALEIMRPLFEEQVSQRQEIKIPSDEEIRAQTLSMFQEIIHIH